MPTVDWRISYRGGPKRGLDAAVFGEALMEYLCAATGHLNACGMLNRHRFPYTGWLFNYFANQAEWRKGGMTKPEPIQVTYTGST